MLPRQVHDAVLIEPVQRSVWWLTPLLIASAVLPLVICAVCCCQRVRRKKATGVGAWHRDEASSALRDRAWGGGPLRVH